MDGGDELEDVLQKMNPEKRHALINSAMYEFGENSYKKASTNNIVKNAGISKGLLYHYFNSKEILYDYLIEFLYSKTTREIIEEVGVVETDIFERLFAVARYKLELTIKYPGLKSFAANLMRTKSLEELKAIVEKFIPSAYYDFYHKNIDFSLFKEDVDIQRALSIVQWTMEKTSEQYIQTIPENEELDMEVAMKDILQNVNMLKKAFYKGGNYD